MREAHARDLSGSSLGRLRAFLSFASGLLRLRVRYPVGRLGASSSSVNNNNNRNPFDRRCRLGAVDVARVLCFVHPGKRRCPAPEGRVPPTRQPRQGPRERARYEREHVSLGVVKGSERPFSLVVPSCCLGGASAFASVVLLGASEDARLRVLVVLSGESRDVRPCDLVVRLGGHVRLRVLGGLMYTSGSDPGGVWAGSC